MIRVEVQSKVSPIVPAISSDANAAEGGEQAETAPRRGRRLPMSLPFEVQHRGVPLNERNRLFAVDLSGTRPRHWKSEFLSIL